MVRRIGGLTSQELLKKNASTTGIEVEGRITAAIPCNLSSVRPLSSTSMFVSTLVQLVRQIVLWCTMCVQVSYKGDTSRSFCTLNYKSKKKENPRAWVTWNDLFIWWIGEFDSSCTLRNGRWYSNLARNAVPGDEVFLTLDLMMNIELSIIIQTVRMSCGWFMKHLWHDSQL